MTELERLASQETLKQLLAQDDSCLVSIASVKRALKQKPTTQERQAESDRFDAAFQDGYNNGYAQARFDYEQEPTTENDLPHCQCTDAEIAKSFLEDVEAVKDQLPITKNDLALIHTEGLDEEIRCTMCTNHMKSDRGCDGSCVVNKDMYKAVMDAIEKRIQPTTKNDLSSELDKNSQKLEKNYGELDCISRADAIRVASGYCHPSNVAKELAKLPSVTPQPCEDAVSRQEVLYLIADDDLSMGQVVRGIHALPSVTPQQCWIPVSEKLPNDRDWYLGIFKEPDTGWINPLPFICDYVGRETTATTKEYWILHGFTDMDEHIDYYFNLECVAWMPLPQAYREVE